MEHGCKHHGADEDDDDDLEYLQEKDGIMRGIAAAEIRLESERIRQAALLKRRLRGIQEEKAETEQTINSIIGNIKDAERRKLMDKERQRQTLEQRLKSRQK